MWPHEYNEDEVKDAENKIRNWCNRSRNYGIFGRLDCSIFSIDDNGPEPREKQVKKHIETEAKNQSDATYRILVRIFNFKNIDFSLYERVIVKLEKQKDNDGIFNEKLDTIKKTLSRLNEYASKN